MLLGKFKMYLYVDFQQTTQYYNNKLISYTTVYWCTFYSVSRNLVQSFNMTLRPKAALVLSTAKVNEDNVLWIKWKNVSLKLLKRICEFKYKLKLL